MFNENVIAKCFGRLARLTSGELLSRILLVAPLLLPVAAQPQSEPTVTLPDHVIGILPSATLLPRTPQMDQDSLTVCVMLNLSDQAGFDAFEKDFNDPTSASFHKPIKANDLTARFGPTQQAYDTVLGYLQQNGFTLAMGSANRLTITVRGTRSQVEAAFNVHINDYVLGHTTFQANDTDPSVPQSVAPLIRSIVGLSNLSRPKPASVPVPNSPMSHATAYDGALTPAGKTNTGGLPPRLDGTGQTIGLIEYDNYDDNDVKAWLKLVGLPKTMIDNVTRFPIDGGKTASNGTGTREVLLDIDAALGIAQGANIIVFVSPGGSNLATINAAIDQMNIVTGGIGGILSSSWSQCELAVPKSEAMSLDSALQTAALSGLTFFADSGDGEATCVAGVPAGDSTTDVHYPANVPHAVAVGGTMLSYGPDSSYGGETWWNSAPRGGAFGVSAYFPTPSYQDPYTSASGRSVPDISADAGAGIIMCQAAVSSTCHDVGGTSLATPTWASVWAIASQAITDAGLPSVSASGSYFYKMPTALHAPSTMTGPGNDFSHVGLGSPDIAKVAAMAVADALAVETVSPIGGSKDGGTTVTITGEGFIGVEKVTFGGVDATNVTIYSDSKLTADSPASASDQVDIQVVTPAGETAKSSKDIFLYVPQVTKVSPNFGPLSGGTIVTVTGKGFSATDTSFDLGFAPATKVTCASSTECTMVTPAWAAGTVQVWAKTAWGTSPGTTNDYFTYQSPVIKSFRPTVGPTTGNMTVNITGAGLSDQMTVNFGGAHGTGIFCGSSSTSCSVISPAAGSVGSVPLTVTDGGVTSLPASPEFTFALFPTVSAVTPNIGVLAGATVTISGTNFSTAPGGTTFTFGAQAATSLTCSSTTQCSVVVPAGNSDSSMALVPVEATVNGHTSLDAASFTYGDTPVVPVVTCSTCHI